MSAVSRLRSLLPWSRPKLRVTRVTRRPARLDGLLVPRTVASATLAHLRASGRHGCEEFVFWSGYVLDDGRALVSRAFLPCTTRKRGHVAVTDDDQLLALTDLVHEHGETVLCQVHTHPEGAFHSPVDDRGAFADEVGFLSLVLPRFGTAGLETAEVFRRSGPGWEHLGRVGDSGIVLVFGDVLSYEGGGWRDV